jgi:hypothetical protein
MANSPLVAIDDRVANPGSGMCGHADPAGSDVSRNDKARGKILCDGPPLHMQFLIEGLIFGTLHTLASFFRFSQPLKYILGFFLLL